MIAPHTEHDPLTGAALTIAARLAPGDAICVRNAALELQLAILCCARPDQAEGFAAEAVALGVRVIEGMRR